ncbi:MAG: NAD(P)-dependent alcohol dehydrogenase [bacterium]|nr:NAD(P)-dependent alcohol dehydrogenase [bacterium]
MKAFIINGYGTIDDIEQVELDYPGIGNDEVLIKVKAAAINPADIKVITGKNGGKFIHSGKSPIALGYDYSGVIKETGGEVREFRRNDEVFGFLPYSRRTEQGSFADYIVVKNGTFARKAPSISHTASASAATTASTALQALVHIGGIRRGQKILINGASGGVGSYAVQIARSFGSEVWGTSSVKNLEFIKSIGVDHALDYQKVSLKDLTEKFDIVLDAASNSSYSKCSAILYSKGVYITLLPSFSLLSGKIRSVFSARKCAVCIVQPRMADLAEIAGMLEDKTIAAPVAASYAIAELKAALQRYEAGGVKGKIGIEIEV